MTTPRRQPALPTRGDRAEEAALPESRASLWGLIAGPLIWAVHFLLSYVTVAIWCAKATAVAASLGGARTALAVYTGVALAAIVAFGWHAWRRHRWGEAELPHDAACAGDRHRFLGFAGFLLCVLSAIAVLYTALAIAAIGTCR